MNDLAEIKQVSKTDLKAFLTQNHTSFTVLSVSTKHIESTDRISVTLSKNSARSFYLGKDKTKTSLNNTPSQPNQPKDDCLQDAQNCTYLAFFNSKEKKLYTRFKDKVESNFEGKQENIDEASTELLEQDKTISQLRGQINQLKLTNQSLTKDLSLSQRLTELRKDPLPNPENGTYLKYAFYFGAITFTIWLLNQN